MSDHSTNFVDQCLAGNAYLDEIESYVELWHRSDTDLEVWDYLGLTQEAYALRVERPCSLRYVLFGRKYRIPLEQALDLESPESLAARAPSRDEAQSVLEWLRKTGRLRRA